jgi:MFS family permease
MGTVMAFDVPARQSFLIQMVEGREELASAIGLNSSMFNGARLVGPAVAGFLIAATSEGVCFLLNALSYLAVLAALLAMRLAPREAAPPHPRVLRELREGFAYAFGFPPIREILLLLVVVNLAAIPLTLVLLPIFTKVILHGGPDTLGLLTASMGCGALLGALRLAFRKSVLGLGRQIAWAGALFGLGLIAFSFSTALWLSMPLLVISGFMLMMETAASNTVVQTIVDDAKRGRVMSFYAMAFFGVAPLGSLLAGGLAVRWGAPRVVQIAGAMCVVASALFALRLPVIREHVRPIYRRIGILPDVTSGIATVADCSVEEGE